MLLTTAITTLQNSSTRASPVSRGVRAVMDLVTAKTAPEFTSRLALRTGVTIRCARAGVSQGDRHDTERVPAALTLGARA